MKVNLNVALDVDPKAWATEFGLGQANNVIRKDVKTYFAGLCHDHPTVLQLGRLRGAALAARADEQHRQIQQGDMRALYGQYPVPDLKEMT